MKSGDKEQLELTDFLNSWTLLGWIQEKSLFIFFLIGYD